MKYGFRAASGGGRSSARETIGRVAAGAIAEKFLKERYGVEIVSWVSGVGDIFLPDDKVDLANISREQVKRREREQERVDSLAGRPAHGPLPLPGDCGEDDRVHQGAGELLGRLWG